MTYCIAIASHLAEDTCPLEKGQCYWQHRTTNKCCYTESDLSHEDYKTLTGTSKPITEQTLDTMRDKLRSALQS